MPVHAPVVQSAVVLQVCRQTGVALPKHDAPRTQSFKKLQLPPTAMVPVAKHPVTSVLPLA